MRIGDVALVALPGEPFVELGLEIKRRSPAPHTFVVGYANDWVGYLPTQVAWEQGGYEVPSEEEQPGMVVTPPPGGVYYRPGISSTGRLDLQVGPDRSREARG